MLIGEGEGKHSEKVGECQGNPDMPVKWSKNGSIAEDIIEPIISTFE